MSFVEKVVSYRPSVPPGKKGEPLVEIAIDVVSNFKKIEKNDELVLYRPKKAEKAKIVKRVVALPGGAARAAPKPKVKAKAK